LARSQFALQWQPPRLVVQQVLVQVVQLAQAQAPVLAQVERRAQVAQLVQEPTQQAQAQQPHSPHQQPQSQCQPELCRLR